MTKTAFRYCASANFIFKQYALPSKKHRKRLEEQFCANRQTLLLLSFSSSLSLYVRSFVTVVPYLCLHKNHPVTV